MATDGTITQASATSIESEAKAEQSPAKEPTAGAGTRGSKETWKQKRKAGKGERRYVTGHLADATVKRKCQQPS